LNVQAQLFGHFKRTANYGYYQLPVTSVLCFRVGMAAAAAEEEARLKEQAANKTKAGHQPSYTRK
jgi:hypothetical protein